VLLSVVALQGTVAGAGPFIGSSPSDSLFSVAGLSRSDGHSDAGSRGRRGRGPAWPRGHSAHRPPSSKTANDAIVTKTLDGTITSWNPAAEKLFGYTANEAVGQNIMMIVPREHRREELTVLSKIARGESVDHLETVRVRKDGTRVHVSLTISPVMAADGSITGASKIARDIGDRMRLEEARNALLAGSKKLEPKPKRENRARTSFWRSSPTSCVPR
jgi:PAS domain S-box-containing protein